jgi:asparagine N-glycosylation enzyme membrane subunit Stt3
MKRIIIAIVVFVVLAAGLVTWKMLTPSADGIDTTKYQAVFLANNTLASNVYFGRLERISDGYYKLTQVYYLQQNSTATDTNKNTNVTLTKMTTQLHGPEDSLILPREQVLYYQNMRSDSKVVQAILQDNQKN